MPCGCCKCLVTALSLSSSWTRFRVAEVVSLQNSHERISVILEGKPSEIRFMSSSDQQHDFATTRWSLIAGGIVWLYFASSKISHQEAILLHASQKHSEQEARVAAAAEREAREKLVGARDWAMSDEGPIDERRCSRKEKRRSCQPSLHDSGRNKPTSNKTISDQTLRLTSCPQQRKNDDQAVTAVADRYFWNRLRNAINLGVPDHRTGIGDRANW